MTCVIPCWCEKHMRDRLLERTELVPSGCLTWMGATNHFGYGFTTYKGKRCWVHRLIWELEHGPITGSLTIDHVRDRGCIYRNCINIDHLEVVTRAENSRRGQIHRWRRFHEAQAAGEPVGPWGTLRRQP